LFIYYTSQVSTRTAARTEV